MPLHCSVADREGKCFSPASSRRGRPYVRRLGVLPAAVRDPGVPEKSQIFWGEARDPLQTDREPRSRTKPGWEGQSPCSSRRASVAVRRKAEKAEMQLLFCPAAERRPEAQTGPGQQALVVRGVRGASKSPGRVRVCNTREKKGGMRRGEAPLA